MPTQARGGNMRLIGQREASYRGGPAAPGAILLPFTSYGLGRDPGKTKDPSVNASPLAGKMGFGDATVQGAVKSIFDLRSVGFWLSLLLGVPTAHKAVTKQPTNITGVTIHYAQAAAPSGNGTLAYTNAGKLLTWTANGEAAGTPVDVTAGGRFTIPSGTANHGVVVEVVAASLPGTDKSDADIAVSATLKAHVFPFNLDTRPSALLELGHPDMSPAKYLKTLGAKVNKFSTDITSKEQDISLDIIAGEETEEAATWDGAPTSYASARAYGCGGFIGGNSALGTVTGGDLSMDNGMKGEKVANQQEGFGLIDQGEVTLGGKIRAVYDGASAYDLARASTSVRLRLGSKAPTTAGDFYLWWDIPNVEFGEKPITKEGKSGIFVDTEWSAHRDVAGNLPLVTLINDVPSY